MAFWTDNAAPKRQYRFSILDSNEGGEGIWYWAKSVTKPSFEISTNEYQLINHKFKYPGTLTWNDVTISIVDTADKTQLLLNKVFNFGYIYPNFANITEYIDGISKSQTEVYFDGISINQLDDKGKVLEEWKLRGAILKSVNFGNLDYSTEDLVSIELTITYDWAQIDGFTVSPLRGATGGVTDAFDPTTQQPNPDVG
jgi:hypothetical protein